MKIAIVQCGEWNDCDGYESLVAQRCTEFMEVDEDTYNKLKKNEWRFKYKVIRSVDDLSEFVGVVVKDYIDELAKEERRREKEKKEREQKKADAAKRKKERDEANKLKLYNDLKREIEGK